MKKSFVVAAVWALTVMSFSSCDFFRSLAGRPTSAELKSSAREKTEIASKGVPVDTVSAPVVESEEYTMIKRQGRLSVPLAYTHTTSTLKAVPEYKYYILVGTYRKKPTMDKMIAQASDAGYKIYLLEYANGLTSVALKPCNTLEEAIDSYAQVSKEDFCPKDACVLIAK